MIIKDPGQFPIFGGDGVACIVGGEANGHPVVNIDPFGVVMQRFDASSGLIHKFDGFQEVLEIIGFVQGLVAFLPFRGFSIHRFEIFN